jgi:hypothetical protein
VAAANDDDDDGLGSVDSDQDAKNDEFLVELYSPPD